MKDTMDKQWQNYSGIFPFSVLDVLKPPENIKGLSNERLITNGVETICPLFRFLAQSLFKKNVTSS